MNPLNTSAPNWRMPVFACLCMLISPLFALGSDRTITQFVHTKWGPKEGAPSPIQALAQDTDGYLWLGTPSGLYRFDGVMFERFEPHDGVLLPEHNVRSLYALPNGDLWIGFHSGEISLLRNGMLTNYSAREGVAGGAVLRFAQDGEGRTWAATSAGLALFDGSRWRQVGEDGNFPGKLALTVFLDRQGTLWAASEDTLTFLPKGANTFQLTGIHVGQVLQIAEAPGGQLWIAETTRSVRPIAVSEKEQLAGQTEIKVGSIGIRLRKRNLN